MLSGMVCSDREFTLRIIAKNALGTAVKDVTCKVGEDLLLLTPLLGFTTWNAFGANVHQKNVVDTAHQLLESGMADYGYQYVNLDSGWQMEYGGKYNAIQPSPKFPDMKGMCDASMHWV